MTPWRKACAEALRVQTESDAIRFWRVSHASATGPRPIFDYRFEHTTAVVKLARWLAPLAGADPEVVECAAWLHDCRKLLNHGQGKDSHAQDAAQAVAGILDGSDFPEGKQDAVRHAILHHVGLRLSHPLSPVATACLWDADKLSKIGAASLIHFGCIAGGFQPVDTAAILEKGEQWLKVARGIADSMNTAPARQEAELRLNFLQGYYRQLHGEWADPMAPSQR